MISPQQLRISVSRTGYLSLVWSYPTLTLVLLQVMGLVLNDGDGVLFYGGAVTTILYNNSTNSIQLKWLEVYAKKKITKTLWEHSMYVFSYIEWSAIFAHNTINSTLYWLNTTLHNTTRYYTIYSRICVFTRWDNLANWKLTLIWY